MREVVYLLIITVLILGFLSSDVIPLFRGSMNVISNIAKKEYENQKIKSNVLIPLDKNVVNGGDVISVIRYFKNDSDVTVEVTLGGNTEVYTNNTYDSAQFNIPYGMEFLCPENEKEYSGDKLSKVVYIQN